MKKIFTAVNIIVRLIVCLAFYVLLSMGQFDGWYWGNNLFPLISNLVFPLEQTHKSLLLAGFFAFVIACLFMDSIRSFLSLIRINHSGKYWKPALFVINIFILVCSSFVTTGLVTSSGNVAVISINFGLMLVSVGLISFLSYGMHRAIGIGYELFVLIGFVLMVLIYFSTYIDIRIISILFLEVLTAFVLVFLLLPKLSSVYNPGLPGKGIRSIYLAVIYSSMVLEFLYYVLSIIKHDPMIVFKPHGMMDYIAYGSLSSLFAIISATSSSGRIDKHVKYTAIGGLTAGLLIAAFQQFSIRGYASAIVTLGIIAYIYFGRKERRK